MNPDVLTQEDTDQEGGFSIARVTYSDLDDSPSATDVPDESMATVEASNQRLATLVPVWEALLIKGKFERMPGQLASIKTDIGPMPERPSARSIWVASLINPLPALGVAYEIRPAMLGAETAAERVKIALNGIITSIAHLDGSRPLGK